MSGKKRPSNCTGKGYLIVLFKAIRPQAGLPQSPRRRAEPGSSALNWNPSVTEGILMEKGSGTVSGEHDAKEPQARRQPTDQVKLSQFEEWHPSHMKTGFRNRRIGRKVPVRVRKKSLSCLRGAAVLWPDL